jgi:hypothetical protein
MMGHDKVVDIDIDNRLAGHLRKEHVQSSAIDIMASNECIL